MPPVIVFGPTGNIGSVASLTAEEHGATVYLAMRDTQKAIPGLTAEREKSGNFERVQADLSQPDTVAAAVKKSGAKRAFTYLAHRSGDHMRATLEALKSAGIEFIVFLSSFTVGGDPHDVKPNDIISFIHAQVEINLEKIFGTENFVAVRPGGFATNVLRYKAGIVAGNVHLHGAGFQQDWITPIDMGKVSGTILASGPKNRQHEVYLYGPQFLSQEDAIQVVGKVLHEDIKITGITPEAAVEQYVQTVRSRELAEYLVRAMNNDNDPTKFAKYDEGVENVKLYTGRPATSFEDWVKANQGLFTA